MSGRTLGLGVDARRYSKLVRTQLPLESGQVRGGPASGSIPPSGGRAFQPGLGTWTPPSPVTHGWPPVRRGLSLGTSALTAEQSDDRSSQPLEGGSQTWGSGGVKRTFADVAQQLDSQRNSGDPEPGADVAEKRPKCNVVEDEGLNRYLIAAAHREAAQQEKEREKILAMSGHVEEIHADVGSIERQLWLLRTTEVENHEDISLLLEQCLEKLRVRLEDVHQNVSSLTLSTTALWPARPPPPSSSVDITPLTGPLYVEPERLGECHW